MIRFIIVLLALTAFAHTALGTTTYSANSEPEIGKRCPDFLLTHVTHFRKKTATLEDFKGQWLFLDFWFTGCSTCINSLPKINELQQVFQSEIKFLLVGKNDKKYNPNIEEVFEKLRIKQNLNLAAAYDSLLAARWGIRSMPHIVIVDPNGIVRYITDGVDFTQEKISQLLKGQVVSFAPKDIVRSEFNGAVENNMIYHSVLTSWNGEAQNGGYEMDRFVQIPARQKGYTLSAVHLAWIYNIAFLGRYYLRTLTDSLYGEVSQFPVLELRDTSRFEFDYVHDLGKGLYNYHLFLPPDRITMENVMRYMQQDLERVFGYKAGVEVREMPVWKLVASRETQRRISSSGGPSYNSASVENSAVGFVARNISMKEFIETLCYYVNEKRRDPFVDGTGISENIDVTIDADLTNLADIRRELKKYGMDFIRSTKKMKVIVIKD